MSLVVLKDILMKVSDELLGFDGGEVIWDLGNTPKIVGFFFLHINNKYMTIFKIRYRTMFIEGCVRHKQ